MALKDEDKMSMSNPTLEEEKMEKMEEEKREKRKKTTNGRR